MAGNLDYLEPKVGQILRAPGTDLATISAKRVRKQLLDLDPSLTAEFLKEHKDEIDSIIARVFEQVSAENAATNGVVGDDDSSDREGSSTSRKRHRDGHSRNGHDDEEEDDDEDRPARPPAKKAKKSAKNGQKISDAELARKLSNEINGRPSRTGGKSSTKARPAKSGRSKKSSETVDSDGESGDDGERKPKKKAGSSGGGARGGFGKEFTLSEPLAEVVSAAKLSRPQVVKYLWVYIKENELQNPGNKREIMCDTKLKAVFGVEKIDMFTMNKVLGKHLHED
ncbi:hypothetical protein MD484_g3660, partial [Candolleomyces efflorescens]